MRAIGILPEQSGISYTPCLSDRRSIAAKLLALVKMKARGGIGVDKLAINGEELVGVARNACRASLWRPVLSKDI